MSSSKQPTRFREKVFEKISAFPLKTEPNNNNNNNNDDANSDKAFADRALPLRVTLFECPSSFVRDYAALFPDVASFREKRPFCLLLFSFSTANDMSGWNQAVEEERVQLHRVFLRLGDAVVARLVNDAGVWADVVDPVGGKPFRGSYCNDNLFETDPRLRPFGVRVEDLGCCKCVRLDAFGSKAFVGCVFTDAPFDSPVWEEIMM